MALSTVMLCWWVHSVCNWVLPNIGMGDHTQAAMLDGI
jgi:hypothetical protein